MCLYGGNAVCATLPLEGVSDVDYEQHVVKQHILLATNKPGKLTCGDLIYLNCQNLI